MASTESILAEGGLADQAQAPRSSVSGVAAYLRVMPQSPQTDHPHRPKLSLKFRPEPTDSENQTRIINCTALREARTP
jgi:hypothetical protein